MNLLLKIILPVLVLIGSAFAAKKMVESKPEAGRRGAPPSIQAVEATRLKPTAYPVMLESRGTVEPTTATTLVPEVAGAVRSVSENFVSGGRFSAGDVLVELDKRDFEIALTQANANLAQARAGLQQEQAQAEVAKREWESLRQGQKPSALTLRQPQVAAARANVRSAAAQVERAQLDLDRAVLIAPYDGIVLNSDVDSGQFVNRGTPIGRIYSVEGVDVRLPLSARQIDWLNLAPSSEGEKPVVTLSSPDSRADVSWTGTLERVEGVDASTQQLNIIARVSNPEATGQAPLRVGQFVNAKIAGRTLDSVFVIPRQALRAGDEVVLVSEDSTLKRQAVTIAWGDAEFVAVSEGLETDAVLVTTPLGAVADDTPVQATIDGVAPPKRQRGGQGGQGGQGGARPGGASDAGGDAGSQRRGDGEAGSQPRRQGAGAGDGQRRGDGSRRGNGQARGNGEGRGRPSNDGESDGAGSDQGRQRRGNGEAKPSRDNT